MGCYKASIICSDNLNVHVKKLEHGSVQSQYWAHLKTVCRLTSSCRCHVKGFLIGNVTKGHSEVNTVVDYTRTKTRFCDSLNSQIMLSWLYVSLLWHSL